MIHDNTEMLNEAINIKYTTLASKEFWVYSFTGTVLGYVE